MAVHTLNQVVLLLLSSLLEVAIAEERVVMMAKSLNWCSYNRAVHLASTSQRAVHVLYAKEGWPLQTIAANGSCAELQKRPDTVDAQPEIPESWHTFGGLRSGLSKPAFVRWLAASSLRSAWHVEDDALFTGAWNILFDAFRDNPADIVATRILRYNDSGRGWNKRLAIGCRVHDRPCAMRGELLHASWPVLRLSRRLALKIAAALDSNTFFGTHEASLVAACRWLLGPRACTIATLRQDHLGLVVLGGERVPASPERVQRNPESRKKKKKPFRRRPRAADFSLPFILRTWGGGEAANATLVQPLRLYHPVKCAADPDISFRVCEGSF